MTTELHVLNVFVGPDGRGGNPLGVFLDGGMIDAGRRQEVATELGFSETIFVDGPPDAGPGATIPVAIFTPGVELDFAGHPTVGAAWLLAEQGLRDVTLRPPAGDVPTRREGELTWVRGRPEWIHEVALVQLESPADVEAVTAPPDGVPSYYPWAWLDEPAGILRSRYLAPLIGIPEDEATGAAAVLMGATLGRPITIRQGVGSELHVRPQADGSVEVGGRVEVVGRRWFG